MTKAGEVQYVVLLNEEAKEIMRGLAFWQRSDGFFQVRSPHPLSNPGIMWSYRASVIEAGIEWVSWHDLRYTFASRLAMQGVPLTTIAAMLRHSTTSLVKNYAYLSPTYFKSAIEEVSSLVG